MILYSQVFMSALPPGDAVVLGAVSVAKSGVTAPSDRLARKVGDHAIASDRAQPLPFARTVRRPRNNANAPLVQRHDHLRVDIVMIGKTPRRAGVGGVLRDVHQ